MSQRAVDNLERVLGLLFRLLEVGEVARQHVHFGRQGAAGAREVRHTLVLEVDEQLGEPALDRLEVIEPRVGGVELLDQLGDTVLEMADGRLVAAGELDPLNLVNQSLDDGLDLMRMLLPAAEVALNDGGWLIVEIGSGQAALVRTLLETSTRLTWARFVSDLAGHPRVLVAYKAQPSV